MLPLFPSEGQDPVLIKFIHSRLAKAKEEEEAKVIFDALHSKIPLMLKFLGNEDDDVSGAVTKFAHDWLTLLKQLSPLTGTLKQYVKELLYTVINKMKYDESYSFDNGVSFYTLDY